MTSHDRSFSCEEFDFIQEFRACSIISKNEDSDWIFLELKIETSKEQISDSLRKSLQKFKESKFYNANEQCKYLIYSILIEYENEIRLLDPLYCLCMNITLGSPCIFHHNIIHFNDQEYIFMENSDFILNKTIKWVLVPFKRSRIISIEQNEKIKIKLWMGDYNIFMMTILTLEDYLELPFASMEMISNESNAIINANENWYILKRDIKLYENFQEKYSSYLREKII